MLVLLNGGSLAALRMSEFDVTCGSFCSLHFFIDQFSINPNTKKCVPFLTSIFNLHSRNRKSETLVCCLILNITTTTTKIGRFFTVQILALIKNTHLKKNGPEDIFFFFCLTWKFDNEHYWSYASLLAIHKWSFFIFWVRNFIKFQNDHILEGRQLIRLICSLSYRKTQNAPEWILFDLWCFHC